MSTILIVSVLSFIIGWVVSNTIIEKKYLKEIDRLNNVLLISENAIRKLKEIHYNQEEKAKEIKDFESVLIKAEEMIKQRDKKIMLLENEYKNLMKKGTIEELIMTKDQFSYIEKQLLEYQKKITKLEKELDNYKRREQSRVKNH